MEHLKDYVNQFDQVVNSAVITDNGGAEIADAFSKIVEELNGIKAAGGTVYLVGNGGSSGIISHVSIDLINACKIKAHPITDNSILTCLANDYGYEKVFSEALKTMIQPGDLLIAISSSGNSQNIVNAVEVANQKGAKSLTLSGFKPENKLRTTGTYNLWIESMSYGYVEIGHALLMHYITDSFIAQ